MRRNGFTLIELLIVVILISILTALTVPRFQRTAADFQLKNASFNLYKVIQYARERALVERRDFQLRFDFNKRNWQLLSAFEKDDAPPDFRPVDGRFGRVSTLSEGLSLEGKIDRLTCHPDGNCDPSAFHIIGTEGAYEISIENLGGIVRIREMPHE